MDYFVALFYWSQDARLLFVIIQGEVMDEAEIVNGLMKLTHRFLSSLLLSCLNWVLSCLICLSGDILIGISAQVLFVGDYWVYCVFLFYSEFYWSFLRFLDRTRRLPILSWRRRRRGIINLILFYKWLRLFYIFGHNC